MKLFTRISAGILAALLIAPSFADIAILPAGATSQQLQVRAVVQSTGAPDTALAYNTSGLSCSYQRPGATVTSITLATQTVSGAYSSGGFVHLANGWYRLDVPDAAIASGVPAVLVTCAATGDTFVDGRVALSPSVNTVALNGTAQTARDIGASVLLSNGTGTGQLSLTSGAVTVGTINSAAINEAAFATTAGSFKPFGIVDQGTAQAATSTTIQLRSALAMADSTANGMTVMACGSTQGYCQSRAVTAYVSSTDTATVDTWTVTPSGTITYYLFGTSPTSGGSGLDAAGVRAAIGLASANLDTQLSTIDDFVDTEVAAIKTKTDFLPSATAGASGGLLIAGTNADFDVTANASFSGGVTITQSTANTAALVVTGNGTGNGATITSGSGATGDGLRVVAASTNGNGYSSQGTGTGSGDLMTGGATGHGANGVGGSTSGSGIRAVASAGNSSGAVFTGQGTGNGATYTSGSGATGNGLQATAASTNGNGIGLTSTGSGLTMTLTPANVTQIAGQTASASGTVTFPNATLASTTNITAGTITTATNLTNLPSIPANWITAAGINSGALTEAKFDSTAGSFLPLNRLDQGTAQAATSTTIQLRSAATFADSTLIGATVVACGSTQGYCQANVISSYVGSTDTATVPTWPVTPSGTITYYVLGTGAGAGGAPSAATVAAAVWDLNTSGHTTASTFGAAMQAAGSAGDPWATALPGAYGAGTAGNIIGNRIDAAITSRLAPATAGRTLVVDAAGLADANVVKLGPSGTGTAQTARDIGASVLLSSGTGTGQLSLSSGAVLLQPTQTGVTIPTVTTLTNAPSDSSGTTTLLSRLTATRSGYLDNLSAGAVPTTAQNAAAVWDLATTGHTTGGTFGAAMQAAGSAGDPWATSLPGAYSAGSAGYILGTNLNATMSSRMATFTLPTNFSSLAITGGGAVTAGTVSDKTGYSLSQAFPTNFSSLSIDGSGRTLLQPTQTGVTIPTVTALTNAPSDSSGTTTLLSRVGTPTGASLAADVAAVPAAVVNTVVEPNGSVTLKCSMAAALAYSAGDLTTTGSSSTYKDPSGTATRITGTVSSPGNRLAAVTCPP